MDLGTQIRVAREKKGYNQKELADLVSATRVAVGCWEENEYVPRKKRLELLESVLGVSLSTTGSRGRAVGVSDEAMSLATEIMRLAKPDRDAVRTIVRSLARNKLAPAMGGMERPAKAGAKKRA